MKMRDKLRLLADIERLNRKRIREFIADANNAQKETSTQPPANASHDHEANSKAVEK